MHHLSATWPSIFDLMPHGSTYLQIIAQKQAFPQLLQRPCTLVWGCRCLTTPGSCPSSPLYTVLPSCPSTCSSTRLPCSSCGIWGILVTEMSYVFPPGVSCPSRSQATFPFSHSHFLSCQPGNVLATGKPRRQGKRFPYDRYNNSGKPLLFLFIIHLLLPGTKDGAANQMHKKTNQSCFCWAWFIARTLLHVERDEIWRDAPDYRCAFRC